MNLHSLALACAAMPPSVRQDPVAISDWTGDDISLAKIKMEAAKQGVRIYVIDSPPKKDYLTDLRAMAANTILPMEFPMPTGPWADIGQPNPPMCGFKNLSPFRVAARRRKNKAARASRRRNRR